MTFPLLEEVSSEELSVSEESELVEVSDSYPVEESSVESSEL